MDRGVVAQRTTPPGEWFKGDMLKAMTWHREININPADFSKQINISVNL